LRPRFEAYISGSDADHFGDLLADLLSAWTSSASPDRVRDAIALHQASFMHLMKVVKGAFRTMCKGKGKGKCWAKGKGKWANPWRGWGCPGEAFSGVEAAQSASGNSLPAAADGLFSFPANLLAGLLSLKGSGKGFMPGKGCEVPGIPLASSAAAVPTVPSSCATTPAPQAAPVPSPAQAVQPGMTDRASELPPWMQMISMWKGKGKGKGMFPWVNAFGGEPQEEAKEKSVGDAGNEMTTPVAIPPSHVEEIATATASSEGHAAEVQADLPLEAAVAKATPDASFTRAAIAEGSKQEESTNAIAEAEAASSGQAACLSAEDDQQEEPKLATAKAEAATEWTVAESNKAASAEEKDESNRAVSAEEQQLQRGVETLMEMGLVADRQAAADLLRSKGGDVAEVAAMLIG